MENVPLRLDRRIFIKHGGLGLVAAAALPFAVYAVGKSMGAGTMEKE